MRYTRHLLDNGRSETGGMDDSVRRKQSLVEEQQAANHTDHTQMKEDAFDRLLTLVIDSDSVARHDASPCVTEAR